MKINRIEHMCEGNGHVIIKELLDEQQLNGKCGLYAEVTLEPGCSLGFHMHYGESETYYILTGENIMTMGLMETCRKRAILPLHQIEEVMDWRIRGILDWCLWR
ncbi:MAG: hypothetical protein ACLU6Y_17020 [Ruminococcus sp.]